MVTQSWCSGLCLASFSSMTSDLCVFITLYPMGWFCFCSGLSLRGVMRILTTVLPQTFTTGTWRCSCQWRFWNVYTGQMCVPSIQNGLKEHSPMQGGADSLGNPLHSPKWNCHFQSRGSPQLCEEFGVNVSWTQWGVAGLCIRSLWSKQVAEPRTCC